MSLKQEIEGLMKEVHEVAKEKGWYDGTIKTDLENHMLMVAEISEATEEVRNGSPALYVQNGKPEGEAVELADVLLRILDYAVHKNLPLVDALLLKHEYNKTRPYRHGNKLK